MDTRFVEVTNGVNWGKFMLGRFDVAEVTRRSAIAEEGEALLHACGWWNAGDPEWLLVFDLQTAEGGFFGLTGDAHADLDKHRLWVCPMFEPFLTWLYERGPERHLDAYPATVELPAAAAALYGYRRPGP